MAVPSSIQPVDYTSRDYASIRADLLLLAKSFLPEWTSHGELDFGVVLVELFSYVGDSLHYYIDRAAQEATLGTATRRSTVLSIAAMLGYTPLSRAPSSVSLSFTATAACSVPAGTKVATITSVGESEIVFETDTLLTFGSAGTNSVAATQGVTHTDEAVGASSGSAGQQFQLYYRGVVAKSVRVFVDEGAGAVEWSEVANILDARATDRSFATWFDENDSMYIEFGDGLSGRVPAPEAVVTATYRSCSGTSGNVAAAKIVQLVTPITGISAVTNASPATGGADSETTASLRQSIPRSLSTLSRAVTVSDYAALARQVSGVAKAAASATVYSNVTVYVAPVGGGTPTTDDLKDAVVAYLEDKKMVDATVTVDYPDYTAIDIDADIIINRAYSSAIVVAACRVAIDDLLAFSNTSFGQTVYLSAVYQALAAVEGVDGATITTLDVASGSGLADVALTADQIPVLGTFTPSPTGGV